jgi:hypothetical protein
MHDDPQFERGFPAAVDDTTGLAFKSNAGPGDDLLSSPSS